MNYTIPKITQEEYTKKDIQIKENCIETVKQIAKENYSDSTYEHAIRVMKYVETNTMIPESQRLICIILAIMHDLLEDTPYVPDDTVSDVIKDGLKLLTKPKNMRYIDYIIRIKDNTNTLEGKCAYWVKLADMKDHLAQTETLTDKLKEKYLSALPYLL